MSYNTVGIIKNGVKQKLPVVMVAPKVDGPNYVEVVADGIKTYRQLLDELYAIMDKNRISEASCIKLAGYYFRLTEKYTFSLVQADANNSSIKYGIETLYVRGSNSYYVYTNATTWTDYSTFTPTSGKTITLYYDTATLDLTTRASNCVYDNSNSGLSATEVQGAIDEVVAKVDRGSVSVTADGVKTNSQLYSELHSQIDYSKVSLNAVLQIGTQVWNLKTRAANYLTFSRLSVGATGGGFRELTVSNTPARYTIDFNTAPGISIHDESATVPSSGTVHTLYY